MTTADIPGNPVTGCALPKFHCFHFLLKLEYRIRVPKIAIISSHPSLKLNNAKLVQCTVNENHATVNEDECLKRVNYSWSQSKYQAWSVHNFDVPISRKANSLE